MVQAIPFDGRQRWSSVHQRLWSGVGFVLHDLNVATFATVTLRVHLDLSAIAVVLDPEISRCVQPGCTKRILHQIFAVGSLVKNVVEQVLEGVYLPPLQAIDNRLGPVGVPCFSTPVKCSLVVLSVSLPHVLQELDDGISISLSLEVPESRRQLGVHDIWHLLQPW